MSGSILRFRICEESSATVAFSGPVDQRAILKLIALLNVSLDAAILEKELPAPPNCGLHGRVPERDRGAGHSTPVPEAPNAAD
jgi:hypothetical protein